MICIEIEDSGLRLRLEHEVWITQNRNGLMTTPHRNHAKGVGDGTSIWSLGELEGYPVARIITLAQYEENSLPPDPDPVLTAEEALKIILGGSI